MWNRFVITIFMLATSIAFGQTQNQVTIEAGLSKSRVYVGDVVTYEIRVRGAQDGSRPDVQFPANVRAEYMGASSQSFTTMRSVNGRQQAQRDAYFMHQ